MKEAEWLMKWGYTEEDLLEIIRAKTKELGRVPLKSEVLQGVIIAKYFGGWAKAIELAGVKVRKKEYTKEDLLEILKAKAEELGRVPLKRDLSQGLIISKRFGGWNRALEAAGMREAKKEYTNEELLDLIRAKAKEVGRAPLKREIPQGLIITKRFGGWDKAIETAGVKVHKYEHTNEELIDIIRAKAEEVGRAPLRSEISQGLIISKRFGGWSKAVEIAGVKENKNEYTNEELIGLIKEKAAERGRVPLKSDLLQGTIITKRFNGWVKALKAAGMANKHSDEDLTGQKFGKLTILEKSKHEKIGSQFVWICQCECGNMVNMLSRYLTREITCNCGSCK